MLAITHFQKLRCTLVVLLIALFSISAVAKDSRTITLDMKNVSLQQVLETIEQQTPYKFSYKTSAIDRKQTVSVTCRNASVSHVLDIALEKTGLTYEILSPRSIVIFERSKNGNARTVRGIILDEEDEPLPGVSVRVKGFATMGTVSDIDGRFSLTVYSPEPELLISYVGMKQREVKATPGRLMTIHLENGENQLNQVVVTGYQTISKERATGAFDILDKRDLEKRIHTDALSALEGEVPGVSVYNNKVVVRGVSTFSSAVGNDPLLVVDGLPTELKLSDININDIESITVLKDAAASSIYGVRAANGVISIVTTKHVKDKTVIRVTGDWIWTQNPSLDDYHYATSSDVLDFELAHIQKYAASSNQTEAYYLKDHLKGIGEAANNSSTLPYYTPFRYARTQYTNGEMSEAEYNALVSKWRNTNYRQEYMDKVWRTALRQSYNVSVNTGTDRQSTYVSLNYIGDSQRVKTNDNKYFKGYVKTMQKLTNWMAFELGVDAQYSHSTSGDAQYTTFNTLEPYTQITDENGNRVYRDYVDISNQTFTGGLHTNPKIQSQIAGLPQFMSYRFNILDELEDNLTKRKNFHLRSFVRLNFDIIKGLKFSSSFSYEFGKDSQETFNSKDSYYIRFLRNRFATNAAVNSVIPAGGRMSMTDYKRDNWTFRNQLDYQATFLNDHAVSLSAGLELRENNTNLPNTSTYYGYDPVSLAYTALNVKDMMNMGLRQSYIYNNNTGNGAVLDGSYIRLSDYELTPSLSAVTNRYFSTYFVGGYTFKQRYGLSGSFRIDQANLFGTDPKYRYRPLWSVGFKWNMAKEKFLRNVPWIVMLDLRGSYGLTGNVDQTTSPYLMARMATQNKYTPETIPYTTIMTAPNPLLRWERTKSYNIGLDYTLFGGKLFGKLDYYHKASDDLLATIEVPFTSGYSSQRVNYGGMNNDGFEISVSSPWFTNKDWRFYSSFSFYYNKNKVTRSYYNPTQASQLISGAYYQQGRPFNSVYAYRYDGLTSGGTDAQNGIPQILRADGSSVVHFNDNGGINIDESATLKPEDLVYMGSGTPVWGGSFTQNISFRNWELSVFVTYYGGHKVYVPSFDFYSTNYNSLTDFYAQSWTPENSTSTIPKHFLRYDVSADAGKVIGLQEMYQKSTVNVKSGDMIRLKNISLGYTLPARLTRKIGMEYVKVIAQVNNPCFWSAAGHGIDPETLGTGGDWTLPEPTSYLLKLNVQF